VIHCDFTWSNYTSTTSERFLLIADKFGFSDFVKKFGRDLKLLYNHQDPNITVLRRDCGDNVRRTLVVNGLHYLFATGY